MHFRTLYRVRDPFKLEMFTAVFVLRPTGSNFKDEKQIYDRIKKIR